MLQLKEISRSLFYTFLLQGSEDFNCKQKQSHLFPKAFQTMAVCRNIIRKQRLCGLFILPLLARL